MENNENKQEESKKEEIHENQPENKANDEQTKKVITILAYIFNILFFVPLLMFPNDEFAKFHANQSLLILIGVAIVSVLCTLGAFIPVVGIVFTIIGGLIGAVALAACIYGIISVVNGEQKELPYIGKFRIIK